MSNYSDLLPNRSEGSLNSPMDHKGSAPYTGDRLIALIEDTNEITANFDIPLVFRRDQSEGSATAHIHLYPDSTLEIALLTGTAEIRAALFASLTNASSKDKIHELFRHFQTTDVRIRIEYQTNHAYKNPREFETEYKIFDKEVLIRITRYTSAPSYGVTGLPIEDRHSLAAKARDRAELSSLRSSLAYRQVIRGFRF